MAKQVDTNRQPRGMHTASDRACISCTYERVVLATATRTDVVDTQTSHLPSM